jgi:hypothetical protein
MPFRIHDNVDHPLNLYAASKKTNELMAHSTHISIVCRSPACLLYGTPWKFDMCCSCSPKSHRTSRSTSSTTANARISPTSRYRRGRGADAGPGRAANRVGWRELIREFGRAVPALQYWQQPAGRTDVFHRMHREGGGQEGDQNIAAAAGDVPRTCVSTLVDDIGSAEDPDRGGRPALSVVQGIYRVA